MHYYFRSMSDPRRVFSQDWDAKPRRGRQRKVWKAERLNEIENGDSAFLAMVEESIGVNQIIKPPSFP